MPSSGGRAAGRPRRVVDDHRGAVLASASALGGRLGGDDEHRVELGDRGAARRARRRPSPAASAGASGAEQPPSRCLARAEALHGQDRDGPHRHGRAHASAAAKSSSLARDAAAPASASSMQRVGLERGQVAVGALVGDEPVDQRRA